MKAFLKQVWKHIRWKSVLANEARRCLPATGTVFGGSGKKLIVVKTFLTIVVQDLWYKSSGSRLRNQMWKPDFHSLPKTKFIPCSHLETLVSYLTE
jgi:hypothetical protein